MEASLMMPFSPGFSQELETAAAYYLPTLPEDDVISVFADLFAGDTSPLGNLMRTSSSISDYDLGEDLFKAPEPIMEEMLPTVDAVAAAFSLISGADDVTAAETMNAMEIESTPSEILVSEVFSDCKNELLAKCGIEESDSGLLEVKVPSVSKDDEPAAKTVKLSPEAPIQKSVSVGCLSSMNWMNGSTMKPSFLDFQGVVFEEAFGMKRAYSEGDIKTLRNSSSSLSSESMIQASFEQQLAISDYKSEERREKLSRYRKKKTTRNFGRKIKYACRKALADSQPRFRGRFAKTEECDAPKPH